MRNRLNLDSYGRKEVLGHIIAPLLVGGLFFISAGRIDLPRAWIWLIAITLYYVGGLMVLLKVNPQLLNARGGLNKHDNTKSWDMPLLQVFAVTGLWGHTVLMGLDVGRFEWTLLDTWFILPGILLTILAFILVYWSMAVNIHFETTVRIQQDRDHKVISSGPYRFLRHPGYLGLIMVTFGSTLILGSRYGIITSVATFIVLAIRTWLEDKTLIEELDGYKEYAGKTRYRLIPFIW